jgi:hypothetical protein
VRGEVRPPEAGAGVGASEVLRDKALSGGTAGVGAAPELELPALAFAVAFEEEVVEEALEALEAAAEEDRGTEEARTKLEVIGTLEEAAVGTVEAGKTEGEVIEAGGGGAEVDAVGATVGTGGGGG